MVIGTRRPGLLFQERGGGKQRRQEEWHIPGATLDQGLSWRAWWKLAGPGLLQALSGQGPGQQAVCKDSPAL